MKERTLDGDRVLTAKERKLVDQSYEHKKEGKLIPISEIKKELGILDKKMLFILLGFQTGLYRFSDTLHSLFNRF